ncbi:MAG: imidazole glycerol phosphate synthase subunit HisH [Bdellovibrionales bacterium]
MIAVVDSGVANLTSVMAALSRLGVEAEITSDAGRIRKADRVIVPGVGAAGAAMTQFKHKNLDTVLPALTQPVLGICLGMQLLFTCSHEGSIPVPCLGILPGNVRALPAGPETPVPHMGWNSLTPTQLGHPLLQGIDKGSYVYFVHSYAAPVSDTTLAATDYGVPFTSIVGSHNFFGCQFHPERSGVVGARMLENFMRI